MTCGTGKTHCPLTFEILGSGLKAAKLERRLSCALAGLGYRAAVTTRIDDERALALGATREPVLVADGKLLTDGLPRTEALEEALRHHPALAAN